MLGIGAGEAMNVVPFGLPWEDPAGRAARLEEAIRIIRLLWTSTRESPASFAGHYYSLRQAFLSQGPTRKPHPPIYVGAMHSKRTLEIAGREGDGWIGWFNTPDLLEKKLKTIEEAARQAGKDPRAIDSMSHLMIAFPRDSEERKEAILGGKASLLMEKHVLGSMGYTAHLEMKQYQNFTISKEHVGAIFRAAADIPDEYVHKSMAIGSAEEVRAKIGEYSRSGLRQVSIIDLLAPKTTKRTLEIFATLLPGFR